MNDFEKELTGNMTCTSGFSIHTSKEDYVIPSKTTINPKLKQNICPPEETDDDEFDMGLKNMLGNL
jgi:hypothetical protein